MYGKLLPSLVSALHIGFQGVTSSEDRESNPGRVNVESGLSVCETVITSDFHSKCFIYLLWSNVCDVIFIFTHLCYFNI